MAVTLVVMLAVMMGAEMAAKKAVTTAVDMVGGWVEKSAVWMATDSRISREIIHN